MSSWCLAAVVEAVKRPLHRVGRVTGCTVCQMGLKLVGMNAALSIQPDVSILSAADDRVRNAEE